MLPSRPMRVLFPVDHKWRDLPGLVWLGTLLERRGHVVYYCRNAMERSALWRYRPDAIVFNHVLDPRRRAFLEEVRAWGVRAIVLATEGIPAFARIPDLDRERFGTLQTVDLQLAWNRAYEEHLGGLGWPAERVVRTGVPRFDFYRKPLCQLHPDRRTFARAWNLDPDRRSVLVTTNFTHARFHLQDRRILASDYDKLGVAKVLHQHGDYPKRDHESREMLVNALAGLAGQLRSANLILRPHPGEDHRYWENAVNRIRRSAQETPVALVTKAYIWELLTNSDVVVERSCTTGVEAWILDLPTIEARLNSDEWYVSEDHASGSLLARNAGELLEQIERSLAGIAMPADVESARRRFLDRWCEPLDGAASSRAAVAIDGLLRSSSPARYPASVRGLAKSISFRVQTALDHWVHDRLLGVSGGWDQLGRLDKWIHSRDVGEWRERLKDVPTGPAASVEATSGARSVRP